MNSRKLFEIQGFVVVARFNIKGIYLVLTDPIKLDNYEGYVDANDLRAHFVLEDIYNLICESFQGSDGYNVQIRVIDEVMDLDFHLPVGETLKLHFDAHLKRKALTKKACAMLSLHKTELMNKRFQYMEAKLSALESEYERLSLDIMFLEDQFSAHEQRLDSIEETLANRSSSNSINIVKKGWFPMTVTFSVLELHLDQPIQTIQVALLQCFPRLRTLSFEGHLLEELKSKSLEELYIRDGNFTAVNGLNISHLPSLKVLHLIRPHGLTNLVECLAQADHRLDAVTIEQCPESIDIHELYTSFGHCLKLKIT
jgi:hypothetical protein